MRLLLLLAVVGCATARPEPAPPPTAPPPAPVPVAAAPRALPSDSEIPAALPFPDPSMIAVVRIKEPLDLAHRLGISNELLGQRFAGFHPADLHPGNAALFVWEPAAGTTPELMALLPTPSDSSFVRHLQTEVKGLQVAPLGKETLAAANAQLLSRRLPEGTALAALEQTPTRDDLSLDLNVVSFLAHYSAPIRDFIARVEAQMAARAKAPGQITDLKHLRAMLDGLGDYATLSLGARVLPESFRVSLVTREKAPQAVEAKPAPEVEAVRYLPPGSLRMQVGGRFFEKIISWSKGFYANLAPGGAALAATLEQNMAAQAKLAKNIRQGALSLSLSPERLIHAFWIVETSEPAAEAELVAKGILAMNDPKVQAEMKQNHVSCSVKQQKAARKIEGVAVDRVTSTCKVQGKAEPGLAAFVGKFYPMTVETALVGDFVVSEINGGDLPRVVHELLAKSPAGPMLLANTIFPEPGLLRLDLDVARLIHELNQVIPQMGGKVQLPEPDGAVPAIAFDGREQGGMSEYRAEIPKTAVAAIGAIIQQLAPQASAAGAARGTR